MLQAACKGAGSIWAEDSSQFVSRQAGNSSYSGKLSRDQAVLKLQAGARGYLARKQVRLQRQEQIDGLVLVQVRACCTVDCIAWKVMHVCSVCVRLTGGQPAAEL
jgi:hypothetical protein